MRQLALGLSLVFGIAGTSHLAFAQQPPPPDEEEPGGKEKKPEPLTPADMGGPPAAVAPAASVEKGARKTWSDIIVVPRKAFLKNGRFEMAPFVGITVNDPLIRHYAIGGQLNYFLTDVLGIGFEGNIYRRNIKDRTSLIGLQYYRVPTMNEMKWAAALNFTYVPIYGKFAFFNRSIVHWEIHAIGGVGLTATEVIPRDPSDASFSNMNITPNLGIGGRFFLNDWMAFWWSFRDYVFPDKFESTRRTPGQTGDQAKSQADTQIINNVVLSLGMSFFLPTSFRYHTTR